jgi:hypothetical protein
MASRLSSPADDPSEAKRARVTEGSSRLRGTMNGVVLSTKDGNGAMDFEIQGSGTGVAGNGL